MNNSQSQSLQKRKMNPTQKLKSRLFEKGIGHSSMSSFKSPLATDYSNRILLVNLASSNSSKFSPKVLKKQVAGFPNAYFKNDEKKQMNKSQCKDRIKTTSGQKQILKQSQFLYDIIKQEKKHNKSQTVSNFYNKTHSYQNSFHDNINEIHARHATAADSNCSDQFRRTKYLVQKLSGKAASCQSEDRRSNSPQSPKSPKAPKIQQAQVNKSRSNSDTKKPKQQQPKMSLQNYISRALKNQPNLQQFLYLVSSKPNNTDNSGFQKQDEDPYELHIMQYDNNKEIQHKLNNKYYTISKKGLCYYINGKPVEFIQLEEWVSQKTNYQKIKNLNFFNRFRRWKTVKMWRKIVLRHRIQQCSKNLQQKLFFLNPVMRQCLFETQNISLQLGKNLVIIGRTNDDYSLQNFKSIQQKTKVQVSQIIEEHSKSSRVFVKKCFDENLRNLRASMKEKQKQQHQQKAHTVISSHINLKDSAFQALGFPPKMSYENRSKLRKLAGKFIRFSYLIDLIHTTGLATFFQNQLAIFITKLKQSQSPTNLQVLMSRQQPPKGNSNNLVTQQNIKMFNVKLNLQQTVINPQTLIKVPFKSLSQDPLQIFNPLYHIKITVPTKNQIQQQRLYCPNICKQWLNMCPKFQDISQQISNQIKQSLNCLKFFQRWSKHRDMQKFINILQQWDDVVSQSRQIAENQNLDPVCIISNFQNSLTQIKNIIGKSLQTINNKIQQQFTQYLNTYWEQKKIDLNLFKNQNLQNSAQTVQLFLKFITTNLSNLDKKIPYRIKLGVFQINLAGVRIQLIKQAQDLYQKFKQILPQVVQQRILFVNNWLNKYNLVIEEQIKNIDDFVNKVKYIKQIQQTFEKKKQLCTNLSSIYQIMQLYKFNTKKRKDFQTITLKAKDQLQKQINLFQQTFQRQSQNYLRQVNRTYLPNIVKDINKLNAIVKNEKFITLPKNTQQNIQIRKQIQQLQKKYQDIDARNTRCIQYQQILNQCHSMNPNNEPQAPKLSSTKRTSKRQSKMINNVMVNIQQMPTHLQDLYTIKQYIKCLEMMWEKYQDWNIIIKKYNKLSIKQILQDKQKIQLKMKQQRTIINNKLIKTLSNNEIIKQLNKNVQIFQKYIPIITGLTTNLSDGHWQQINQLAHKINSSLVLDLKKIDILTLNDMIQSSIGQFKQQFQQIFVKAQNQIKLQNQYNQLEKKWKSIVIKTKIQGKYHIIFDQNQHTTILQLFDQTLTILSQIFANTYSMRLQIGILTYQSVLLCMQTYKKWINVQRKLIAFDRIYKSIDSKKIIQGNLLQTAQKQYKAIFKILLTRNIQTYFNITKFIPNGNINISQKLSQCQKILITLQNNIKTMLNQYRKNYPLFYKLNDKQLLHIIMQTSSHNNSNSTTNLLPSIIKQLIINKYQKDIIKQIIIQGERITSIITIDNQNVLKSTISITTDLQTILNSIIDTVGDYCRRMMKLCRNKSGEISLLEIVDQFNIQFLLAISKVDFSNYTAISIQNRQFNGESLKQYLKILIKDTKNGIQKLKQKRNGNIYGYETLILQNLLHQKILQQLVTKNIQCANQYSWIKYLRFYWQDSSSTNNQDINITIRKMHISLHYGRQYIGSKTRVLIDNCCTNNKQYENLDMIMSVIRNSQNYIYLGNIDRLNNFMNCIAHHMQIIKCQKQMGNNIGNCFRNILKSKQDIDCIYYIQDCHLLSQQTISQLLTFRNNNNETFITNNNKQSLNSPHTNLTLKSSKMDLTLKYTSGLVIQDNINNNYYNPIFLHFPKNQNNLFRINRQQYRNVSLISPNIDFLQCYIYLIQQNIRRENIDKNKISNKILLEHKNSHKDKINKINSININNNSNSNNNNINNRTKLNSFSQEQQMQISPKQTITVVSKIFNIIAELEPTQNCAKLCVQVFLRDFKRKVRRILRNQQQTATKSNKLIQKLIKYQSNSQNNQNQSTNQHIQLHDVILIIMVQYLQKYITQNSLNIVKQYIKSAYPHIKFIQQLYPQQRILQYDQQQKQRQKLRIKIRTGLKDYLKNYYQIQKQTNQSQNSNLQIINIQQFTQQQLYGNINTQNQGLLHKLFYKSTVNQNQTANNNKRTIIFKGINQRLVKYLSMLIQQNTNSNNNIDNNYSNNKNQKVVYQQTQSNQPSSISNRSSIKITQNQGYKNNNMNYINTYFFDKQQSKNNYIVESILERYYSNKVIATSINNKCLLSSQISIQIHTETLSQLIDPKILTQFKIQAINNQYFNVWKYLEQKIKIWMDQKLCNKQKEKEKNKMIMNTNEETDRKYILMRNCISKFYNSTIKGLWKDLYKITQNSANNDKNFISPQIISTTMNQLMINIIRDFLNFLQTLLPQVYSSIQTFTSQKDSQKFQHTIIYACMYSLCYIYKQTLYKDTQYIKLQNSMDKLQNQTWLNIPQNQRIKPQQYQLESEKNVFGFNVNSKKLTYFDFIFDGIKLLPIQQYSKSKYTDRILERGQYYLTQQFIHYNLISERTLNNTKYGILLLGPKNSGKTCFSNVYKTLHYEQSTHLHIYAMNKNKKQLYNKLCKVMSIQNILTIGPKLNYNKSLIVIDDLSLPIQNNNSNNNNNIENESQNNKYKQIISFITTMINQKILLTPQNYKRYKLNNTKFIINSTVNENRKQNILGFQDCTIKCNFTDLNNCQNQFGLRKIFTQILKANVLDPDIQQKPLSKIVQLSFDIFEQISTKSMLQIPQIDKKQSIINENVLNLQILKRMIMFTSHLRFKQNNPSINQISRFWAYLLKDNFSPYCTKYNLQFSNLQCIKKYIQKQNTSKSLSQYIKQPLQSILYSHLFIKQQIHGIGKQVQHVRDLRKLSNSINQTIQQYNKTDKIKRYGNMFEFISLEEIFIKIIKMSNLLINSDYAIFSRKGSQINGLIRLVSYMQGFNYKQKNNINSISNINNGIQDNNNSNNINNNKKEIKILDMVKQTLQQITKVSSYLISMKVDDNNIQQFLQYYDCDFEGQIVNSLLNNDLHCIQNLGALNFGINSQQTNQNNINNNMKNISNSQYKNSNQISNKINMLNSSFKATHSHSASKDLPEMIGTLNPKSRSQSATCPQSTRIMKPTLRQISKMKKSIRIIFQFNSLKYLKYPTSHPYHIPNHIYTKLHIDFFQQYPKQSILRFSQDILGISTSSQQSVQVRQLIQASKQKLNLMCQIYLNMREQLNLTLKQYQECIRLYWSFVGTFPQQIKQKLQKYSSIIDMNQKLLQNISDIDMKMQQKWEQKKQITQLISKIKSTPYNTNNTNGSNKQQQQSSQNIQQTQQKIQQLQLKLQTLNISLQQLTQKKSQCEKLVLFYKPSINNIKQKHKLTQILLQNNNTYLKDCLVIIASYFTYLSKYTYTKRKNYLKNWYNKCSILKQLPQQKHIQSICELFCLIREQDMIINQDNQQYYENMTIILQSIKPVLIRDDKYHGRNWMKYFDTSFATLSQSQPEFYNKLGQLLGSSNNILLQITNQQTLNNSQNNYINSLIFMSQNTPKIQINDIQYTVSKQSKVYIVLASHLIIPQQILSQHLYISYQQDQNILLKNIQNQIMITNGIQKYNNYIQYKKKQLFVRNQLLNLQYSLANMVWHQFYGKQEQDDNQNQDNKDKQNTDKHINDTKNNTNNNNNNKQGKLQLKQKQQILQQLQILTKNGIIDKLQQFVDKYNNKIKLLQQIRDKISNIMLVSNYNQNHNPQIFKNKQNKDNNNSNKNSLNKLRSKNTISNKDINLSNRNLSLNIKSSSLKPQVPKQNKRISSMQPINNPNPLQKVLNIITKSYNLLQRIQKFLPYKLTSLSTYYQIIKMAIKRNLLMINLSSQSIQLSYNMGYNMGMFVLFVLRQWGQRLNRELYIFMAIGLMIIMQEELKYNGCMNNKIILNQSNTDIYQQQQYIKTLKQFIQILDTSTPSTNPIDTWTQKYLIKSKTNKNTSKILLKFTQQLKSRSLSYNLQTIQQIIIQSLYQYIDQQSYYTLIYTHNCIPTIILPSININMNVGNKKYKYQNNIIQPILLSLNNNNNSQYQNIVDQSWLLKYIVIYTGKIHNNLHHNILQNDNQYINNNIDKQDIQNYNNIINRKYVQKMLGFQNNQGCDSLVQIKNNQNIENQIKKILNDKQCIYMPISQNNKNNKNSNIKYNIKSKILQNILSELSTKISPQHHQSIISQQKRSSKSYQPNTSPLNSQYMNSSHSNSHNNHPTSSNSTNPMSISAPLNVNSIIQQTLNSTNNQSNNSHNNNTHNKIQQCNRIHQQFKLYIYNNNNIKQIIQIISKCLNINENKIYQNIYIKDISNQMSINYGIANKYKNKVMKQFGINGNGNNGNTENNIRCSANTYISNTNSNSNNNNTNSNKNSTILINHNNITNSNSKYNAAKSRRHINIISDQQTQKQNIHKPIPSMKIVESQQNVIHHIRTNKNVPNNNQTHSNYNNNYNNQLSQFSLSLYQSITLIIQHLQQKIKIKTGHLDIHNNYFNKIYLNPTYFNGIQKIVQNIAMDNQLWNFGKSLIVICQIIGNLVKNIRDCYIREQILKTMDKIINKIKQFNNNLNVNADKQKLKNIDNSGQDNINQQEISKYVSLLTQILYQDTNLGLSDVRNSDNKNNNNCLWDKYKQQSQFIYFKRTFIDKFRQFIGMQPLPLKLNSSSIQSIINIGLKNVNSNLSKRSSRRSKNMNMITSDLRQSQSAAQFKKQQKQSKQLLSSFVKNMKNIAQLAKQTQQSNDQSIIKNPINNIQNKQLNKLSSQYLQQNIKSIQIKLNIIKDHYQYINKYVHSINIDELQNCKQEKQKYISMVIYNLILINNANIICQPWRAYIKDCLKQDQQCLYISNTFKKMIQNKGDLQRQLSKISKFPGYAIDLISCTYPIQFIKAYISNQFQQKISKTKAKQLYEINNQQKNQIRQSLSKKDQALYYYCITNSMPNQQLKNQNYIKIKTILAVGWKLNNQGTYQLTQQDKITQLNNVCIARKLRPQQTGVCEINLCESEENRDNKIKLYAFTKKNQGKNVCKNAYISCKVKSMNQSQI